MDIIISYLENMFAGLPRTPKTEKAKMELLAMMEDKYNELKAQGVPENEIIGTIISEFGNLSELAEELDLDESELERKPRLTIGLEEAREYIAASVKSSRLIGLGVMLCIFSPILLIILLGASDIGIIRISENTAAFFGLLWLFSLIAIAIALFITTGMRMKKFENLKSLEFDMDRATYAYVRQSADAFKPSYVLYITLGVILCIISVVPLLGAALLLDGNDFSVICGVGMLLLFVGIGVFLLVNAGMVKDCHSVLLQEGEYADKKAYNRNNRIAGVYWSCVVCIYLAWSFITFRWDMTWIIWPIASVLFGAISAVASSMGKKNRPVS